MRQRVIVGRPPVYDRCIAVFGQDVIVGKPIIWSWGEVIYNPLDIDITRELYAHEAVHGARQQDDVLAWWDKYLLYPQFRYVEEYLAHRAEWKNLVKHAPGKNLAADFEAIAGRLASPLYGSVTTLEAAKADILG